MTTITIVGLAANLIAMSMHIIAYIWYRKARKRLTALYEELAEEEFKRVASKAGVLRPVLVTNINAGR